MDPPRLLAGAALCLLLSACSGGREAAVPPPTPPPKPAPVTRTVQGFRIQILTTPEKAAADRQAGQAESWWSTLPPGERSPYLGQRALLVDVAWKQPYYRVRLGAFASRAEARQALATVKRRFPGAFLVPALVTLTR